MCNMIKIINTAVCYKLLTEFILKVLITREKNFFSISLMLCLYEMMDVH